MSNARVGEMAEPDQQNAAVREQPSHHRQVINERDESGKPDKDQPPDTSVLHAALLNCESEEESSPVPLTFALSGARQRRR
jgi:hypothetical protein